jgi:hypothetical protein
MAVASTAGDYSSLNEAKEPLFGGKANNGGGDQSQLNFYESIYNFKKMFPKLDYEVIETVLRSNNGNIDKSLDQLLTMSIDTEVIQAAVDGETTTTPVAPTTTTSTQNSNGATNLNDSTDQPPSYSELVSMNLIDETKSEAEKEISTKSSVAVKKPSHHSGASQRQSELKSTSDELFFTKPGPSLNSKPAQSVKTSAKYINNFNKMLIGDLSKDFLRIKINDVQVKKLKSSIKKAKRSEIVAILNNVIKKNKTFIFHLKNINQLCFGLRKRQKIRSSRFN